MKCANPLCNKEHDRRKWCSNECKWEVLKANKRDLNADKHLSTSLNCLHCKCSFIPRRRVDEVFCTNECKIEYHKNEARKKSASFRQNTKRNCLVCDVSFTPKVSLKQIYCSRKCRERFGKKVYKAMQTCLKQFGTEKSGHTFDILGYTANDLMEHIQSFPAWPSLKDEQWHLDHKFPIKAFVERGINDISLICCIDNLQPLTGIENTSKNDNYDIEEFENWLTAKGISRSLT